MPNGRWALMKLMTGALRIGVSARLAKTALAEMAASAAVDDIEEVWHGLTPPYRPLFAWLEGKAERPAVEHSGAGFLPLMLANPLRGRGHRHARSRRSSAPNGNGTASACSSSSGGETPLYSRTGDDIGPALSRHAGGDGFRRPCSTASCWCAATAWWRRSTTCSSGSTARPSRAKMLRDYPACVRLYDMLFEGRRICARCRLTDAAPAARGLVSRRTAAPADRPVAAAAFDDWDELAELRDGAARATASRADAEARRQRLCRRAGRKGRGSSGSATR